MLRSYQKAVGVEGQSPFVFAFEIIFSCVLKMFFT
jgi:hypothetical protein